MKFNDIKELIIGPAIFILAIIIFFSMSFTVSEVDDAIVTRFGGQVIKVIVSKNTPELEKEIHSIDKFKNVKVVEGKGLFFKLPIIDSVQKFNNRLLTYDTEPREVTTMDKKKLILDNNAQWQIVNPLLFRISMGNQRNAHTRVDDIMYSKLNEKIGRTEAHVLISDKTYVENMLNKVTEEINMEVAQYGIRVADIRIKKTDLPPENSTNIFNRMKTEREQKAKQYRSEGKEEAQKIKSEADKEARVIEAQAYADAEKIKGEGDAEATRIYNEAYNQDPEFYEFYRTLQTYKATLKDKTKIVIDANSPFAKYLFSK